MRLCEMNAIQYIPYTYRINMRDLPFFCRLFVNKYCVCEIGFAKKKVVKVTGLSVVARTYCSSQGLSADAEIGLLIVQKRRPI